MTNKPRRRIWVVVAIIAIAFIVAGGVGFLIAMGVSRVNQEAVVKDELITQNARLRASMMDGVLLPASIASTKSTEKVSIELQVSSDYKDYCIEASLIGGPEGIKYHMLKDTPDLEPMSGLCGENATAKPAKPLDVAVGSIGSTVASFTWATVPGASSYVIRCSLSATSDNMKTSKATSSQGNIENLTAGTTYACDVAAVNSLGQGEWSDKITITTQALVAMVKELKISTESQTSLSYEWEPVAGAREYVLEYATDTSFSKDLKQIRTKNTQGTISGLEKYSAYYFHVKVLTGSTPESLAPFSTVVQSRTAQ